MTAEEYYYFRKWFVKHVSRENLYLKKWKNGEVWIGNRNANEMGYYHRIIQMVQDCGYTIKFINPFIVQVEKKQ